MYTLNGLKRIAEHDEPTLSINFVKEALKLLEETLDDIKNTTLFLKEHFSIEVADQVTALNEKAAFYRIVANGPQESVERNVFLAMYELTVDATEKLKQVYEILNEEFRNIPFKRIDAKPLVLKGNSLSFHQLGLFDYSEDMLITVDHESEDYYMGAFWYSHFMQVKFLKQDVRDLTAEEKRKEEIV